MPPTPLAAEVTQCSQLVYDPCRRRRAWGDTGDMTHLGTCADDENRGYFASYANRVGTCADSARGKVEIHADSVCHHTHIILESCVHCTGGIRRLCARRDFYSFRYHIDRGCTLWLLFEPRQTRVNFRPVNVHLRRRWFRICTYKIWQP